jgi:hypothetical protein
LAYSSVQVDFIIFLHASPLYYHPTLPLHSTTPPFQQPILQIRAPTRLIVINGWLDDFVTIRLLTSSAIFYLWRPVSIYSSVTRKDLLGSVTPPSTDDLCGFFIRVYAP